MPRARDLEKVSLSEQEEQVIALALRNYDLKETANILKVSLHTIRSARQRAFNKLGCGSVQELIAMAYSQNALPLWLCDSLIKTPHEKRRELLLKSYYS